MRSIDEPFWIVLQIGDGDLLRAAIVQHQLQLVLVVERDQHTLAVWRERPLERLLAPPARRGGAWCAVGKRFAEQLDEGLRPPHLAATFVERRDLAVAHLSPLVERQQAAVVEQHQIDGHPRGRVRRSRPSAPVDRHACTQPATRCRRDDRLHLTIRRHDRLHLGRCPVVRSRVRSEHECAEEEPSPHRGPDGARCATVAIVPGVDNPCDGRGAAPV